MPTNAEFARKLFSGACEFVAGAAELTALPEFALPEMAFVGRSNVGKSSLINALTNRTSLARVSHTPGRTGHLLDVEQPAFNGSAICDHAAGRCRDTPFQ